CPQARAAGRGDSPPAGCGAPVRRAAALRAHHRRAGRCGRDHRRRRRIGARGGLVTSGAEAAVIVCSRDRPALLRDTIASIIGGSTVPRELLVIDQSREPDRHIEELTAPAGCELRYVWTRSAGLSRANNEGARLATSETLVFTHDDVLVDAGWLGML